MRISESKIVVNGKEANRFAVRQRDGQFGLKAKKGQLFNVQLENTLSVPTSIHWHGLLLPNEQDGVAFITQFPIYPNQSYLYQFPLVQSGTYWMHAHYGLQEQRLLSAPLILEDPEDQQLADQELVLFLSDFSFTPPSEIYRQLRCPKNQPMADMKQMKPDIVDVNYDAFLANDRTLENPEMVQVQPGERVRLRIINGASSTNFFILLGKLEGEAIAVDGNRIKPIKGTQFELGVAQRIDIIVTIPEEGAFPILAQGEGTTMRTGLILFTKQLPMPKLNTHVSEKWEG